MIRLVLVYLMGIHLSYLDLNNDEPRDNLTIVLLSILITGLELSIGYSIFKALGI